MSHLSNSAVSITGFLCSTFWPNLPQNRIFSKLHWWKKNLLFEWETTLLWGVRVKLNTELATRYAWCYNVTVPKPLNFSVMSFLQFKWLNLFLWAYAFMLVLKRRCQLGCTFYPAERTVSLALSTREESLF